MTYQDLPKKIVSDSDVADGSAITHAKLANITAGSVLLGNASNVPTATALSGDVTVTSAGVTAIAAGVIVNADVSASAAIVSSKLAGRVDSVNPAASELGYMTGTQRAGTNGSSYSTRATTTWPSSVGSLVSVTLNKGLYWVSYACGGYAASGSASTETYLYVGGTAVTTLVRGRADTSGVSGACGALPVLITADSTAVAVYGLVNGGLSITAPTQELWAMRIA